MVSGSWVHMAMMLAAWVHDLNPFIFRVTESFGPRWYGAAYLLAFLAGYVLLVRLARQGILRMPPERVPDLVLAVCIFGVLVGGRLGYVLFYDLPEALRAGTTPLLWQFSGDVPFWGVLKVWKGGMAAHGGVIGVILTLIVFARRNRLSIPNVGDAACMVVPLGLFFGRIANFINGELYGHVANVPWAVKFPTEVSSPTNGVQVVPQEAVDKVIWEVNEKLGSGVINSNQQLVEFIQGTLPLPGLSGEAYRSVSDFATQQMGLILPARHPSQLYQALLEGLLLFVICWVIGKKWRKDGMAGGAFLTFYPILRILGEQFRVGDTPVQVLGVEMSKGVLYSVPMAAAGVVYWVYWIRRPGRVVPAEGGGGGSA